MREREVDEAAHRNHARQCDPEGHHQAKGVTPAPSRQVVAHVCTTQEVSERRACQTVRFDLDGALPAGPPRGRFAGEEACGRKWALELRAPLAPPLRSSERRSLSASVQVSRRCRFLGRRRDAGAAGSGRRRRSAQARIRGRWRGPVQRSLWRLDPSTGADGGLLSARRTRCRMSLQSCGAWPGLVVPSRRQDIALVAVPIARSRPSVVVAGS